MSIPLRLLAALCLLAAALAITQASSPPTPSAAAAPACPWIAQAQSHSLSPTALAAELQSSMSLYQEASYLVLSTQLPYENANSAIPALCLPALTLDDGTSGVAGPWPGVTQFPAQIAQGAAFDPTLTYDVARAQATEARARGIDVVQAPDLNLARSVLGGRNFETYGEDPYLAATLGVAAVDGIQSTGDLAEAKHLGVYTQEVRRVGLNQVVSPRVLTELYEAPFRAVVTQAHVAGLMCSYGSINGVNTCSDPALYAALASWGFTGFVRSDLMAVPATPAATAAAFRAGLSMIKPYTATALVDLVNSGQVPRSEIDATIRRLLAEMFAAGLITAPPTSSTTAISSADQVLASRAATESAVLLRNQGSLLPLPATAPTIAVSGIDAGPQASVTGYGSSEVNSPGLNQPINAIRATFPAASVSYSPGSVSPTLAPLSPSTPTIPVVPTAQISPIPVGPRANWLTWVDTIAPTSTARVFQLDLRQQGDLWITLNGQPLVSGSSWRPIPAHLSTAFAVPAGASATLRITWYQINALSLPSYALTDVTSLIADAATAAAHARYAIVMAGDTETESADRTTLSLPGDANYLIAAVAAANPSTIVILNTGGPVTMPWLSSVGAVIEDWYPGQTDGAAVARLLSGQVDPSGRLPVTFPLSSSGATPSVEQYPGVNGVVTLSEGLDIGYRWYQATNTPVLFPFGFGLSYTTFSIGSPSLSVNAAGVVTLRVPVTNTGSVSGTDVVQAYVGYPSSLGEPPWQLRAFSRVDLAPGATTDVTLSLPPDSFSSYQAGQMVDVPGTYTIAVGSSSVDIPWRLTLTLPATPTPTTTTTTTTTTTPSPTTTLPTTTTTLGLHWACPSGWTNDGPMTCYRLVSGSGPTGTTCNVNGGYHWSSGWHYCIKYIPAKLVP